MLNFVRRSDRCRFFAVDLGSAWTFLPVGDHLLFDHALFRNNSQGGVELLVTPGCMSGSGRLDQNVARRAREKQRQRDREKEL